MPQISQISQATLLNFQDYNAKIWFLKKNLRDLETFHINILYKYLPMSMSKYFDVVTRTPAGILLERLWTKNWNVKTPFTHGLRHFWAKTPKSKKKKLKKGFNIMLSDSWKSAFKMTSEDAKKILQKSTKNMKLSGFFSNLRGLNYPSYQLFEATFQ